MREHAEDAAWAAGLASPFFISWGDRAERTAAFRVAFPEAAAAVLQAADRFLQHEHDLLGSGPRALGWPLPWHQDFKSGHRWPLRPAAELDLLELDQPSDVKVPWELSRCQHFTTLGQAYWLTADERYAREIVAQIDDWILENPSGQGVNWACAMDVALRAVSWTWALHFLGESPACTKAFRDRWLRSLHDHGLFLAAHHHRGAVVHNHYVCEGVGLVFLGHLFATDPEGRGWLDRGHDTVVTEIEAQVHADGVDFEQSTAYQRLVLEAFLTAFLLLRRADRDPPAASWDRLAAMCAYVAAFTRPDGQAPLHGDADDGRVQKLGAQPIGDHRYLLSTAAVVFDRADFKQAAGRFWEESFWLLGADAERAFARIPAATGLPSSREFRDGGVFVLRSRDVHLVVDCGEVGMAGRGGHGHNDILGFELWMHGGGVVTDCGTFVYSASREWRNRFRGTAFHSVVEVEGEELNRLAFPERLWRLCYDAVPTAVTFRPGADADYFRGGHRGYERLASPVVTWREILLRKDAGEVVIRDSLKGSGRHDIRSRFHLDPALRPSLHGSDVRLERPAGELWLQRVASDGVLATTLEPGWVSPCYGVKVRTEVVVVHGTIDLPFQVTHSFSLRAPSAAARSEALAELERAARAPVAADRSSRGDRLAP